jgi:hypothetical protein
MKLLKYQANATVRAMFKRAKATTLAMNQRAALAVASKRGSSGLMARPFLASGWI